MDAKDLLTLAELRRVLTAKDLPEQILEIFDQYKTRNAISNAMDKLYRDSQKTSAVYKKLKPLLKEKNKS